MIRHAAAAAMMLCLCPALVDAQSTEFTVNSAAANVHKAPSTGSPVIGKAARGTVLEVTRHLGDWVRVTWTDAPDAAGYVHLSAGSLAPSGSGGSKAASPMPARQDPAPSRATVAASRVPGDAPPPRGSLWDPEFPSHEHTPAPSPAVYVNPPAHRFGFGGLVSGSTLGFGGSARFWGQRRLGVQIGVSRFAVTNPSLPGRVTTVQMAPTVLYAFRDRVTDSFWLRPYAGGGLNIQSHRLSDPAIPAVATSEKNVGYQALGGTEITFPNMPRFALSADAGYRWGKTAFTGFELDGFAFSLSGHWYWR